MEYDNIAGFSVLPNCAQEPNLGGQVAEKALEPDRPVFKSAAFLLYDIGQVT